MKKILGIIILILLWCENLYAVSQTDIINQYLKNRKLDPIEGIWIYDAGLVEAIYKSGNSYVGVVIKSSQMRNGARSSDLRKGSDTVYYGTAYAKAGSSPANFKVFGDTLRVDGNWKGQSWSNTANRIWPSDIVAHNAKFKTKKDIAKEEQVIADMVADAQKTCKVIGFEDGSEKFADCTLKLYTQKVDELVASRQAAYTTTQGQTTTQGSGSNVMTIYDPVRDSNALFKRGQGLINGTCTLGNLSTC
jgi:hypothetical protein|tara:strand:- start:187 stop:930 length:744 start_codon:yes stop_codon:yes gene_type:complete